MTRVPQPHDGASARDIAANRAARKWTTKELLGRLAWEWLGSIAFALTPRPLWGVRRTILRLFGARIGEGVHIFPSVRIAVPWNLTMDAFSSLGDRAIVYNLGPVTIGQRVTVSQFAHLCAGSHDHTAKTFDLIKPPITIGDEAWVCADAFVGPGVTIGRGAIVGARAVVVKDVADAVLVAGNPAIVVKQLSPRTEG